MPLIRAREPQRTSITAVTVGATSTEVLAANPERSYAAIVNDADEAIYLARGETAVVGQGIRLNAAGGSYEITELNPWTGIVNGICSSGGKSVTVQEDSG